MRRLLLLSDADVHAGLRPHRRTRPVRRGPRRAGVAPQTAAPLRRRRGPHRRASTRLVVVLVKRGELAQEIGLAKQA